MTCYKPLSAFDTGLKTDTGKTRIVIRPCRTLKTTFHGSVLHNPILVPCGKCIGCKLDRAKEWSLRIMLEASLYDDSLNHFVTLTYDDEHNPVTLVKKHVQDFMKRLRSRFSDRKIRFFLCGEYGGSTARPHYHLVLMNCPLDDLEPFYKVHFNGLYTSKLINECWHNKGMVTIGSLTVKSAGYTARYCLKKTGESRDDKVRMLKHGLVPEFTLMSRNPGIGAYAFKKEWFLNQEIFMSGQKFKIPRFYNQMLERMEYDLSGLKDFAREKFLIYIKEFDNYFDELAKRELIKNEQIKILKIRKCDSV